MTFVSSTVELGRKLRRSAQYLPQLNTLAVELLRSLGGPRLRYRRVRLLGHDHLRDPVVGLRCAHPLADATSCDAAILRLRHLEVIWWSEREDPFKGDRENVVLVEIPRGSQNVRRFRSDFLGDERAQVFADESTRTGCAFVPKIISPLRPSIM